MALFFSLVFVHMPNAHVDWRSQRRGIDRNQANESKVPVKIPVLIAGYLSEMTLYMHRSYPSTLLVLPRHVISCTPMFTRLTLCSILVLKRRKSILPWSPMFQPSRRKRNCSNTPLYRSAIRESRRETTTSKGKRTFRAGIETTWLSQRRHPIGHSQRLANPDLYLPKADVCPALCVFPINPTH